MFIRNIEDTAKFVSLAGQKGFAEGTVVGEKSGSGEITMGCSDGWISVSVKLPSGEKKFEPPRGTLLHEAVKWINSNFF